MTSIPGGEQLMLMLCCPLEHHGSDSNWRLTLNDDQRPNPHNQFTIIIDGVKASAQLAHTKHPNHNSVELEITGISFTFLELSVGTFGVFAFQSQVIFHSILLKDAEDLRFVSTFSDSSSAV